MVVRFIKGAATAPHDTLSCRRDDGTERIFEMPRGGVLPTLAIVYVVESALAERDGFLGATAAGREPTSPGAQQSLVLAECLQAEQWGGAMAPNIFTQKLAQASTLAGVPPRAIDAATLQLTRQRLREFGALWRPLPPGGQLEREF